MKTSKPKDLETIKGNKSDDNKKLLKYKEIFDELTNEIIGERCNASEQIDFNNLTYKFEDESLDPINHIGFKDPMHIYNNIKNGNSSWEKIEKDQD